MADLIHDDFARADVVPSATALGAPWTQPTGSIGIQNGQAYVTANGENLAIIAGVRDVDISYQVQAGGSYDSGVIFRYRDTSNYWFLGSDGALYRKINGGFNLINAIFKTPFTPGDVLRAVCIGNGISLFLNGALMSTREDSLSKDGETSIGMRLSSNGNHIEYVYAKPTDPAEFPAVASALSPTLDNLVAALPGTKPDSFVYKGRDSKTADSGSVA